MKRHELKTWPQFFEEVASGRKSFEIRKNDRAFEVGDWLHLREWSPESQKFTGRSTWRRVTYMTDWMQQPGYVVMSLDMTMM